MANNNEIAKKLFHTGMVLRHIDNPGKPHGKGPHGKHGKPQGEGPRGQHGKPQGAECKQHRDDKHAKMQRRKFRGRLISLINLKPGICERELAFLADANPMCLSKCLAKMEERGIVERKPAEDNEQIITVTLTEKGQQKAAKIAERKRTTSADILAVLSDEEMQQLESILGKLEAELAKRNPHKGHGKRKEEKAADAE